VTPKASSGKHLNLNIEENSQASGEGTDRMMTDREEIRVENID
jgi:hypothetical protein